MDLIDAFAVASRMDDTGSMPHQIVKWLCLSDSNFSMETHERNAASFARQDRDGVPACEADWCPDLQLCPDKNLFGQTLCGRTVASVTPGEKRKFPSVPRTHTNQSTITTRKR